MSPVDGQIAGAVITGAIGILHLYFAHHMGHRQLAGDASRAWLAFRLWWVGTGVTALGVAAATALSLSNAPGIAHLVASAALEKIALAFAAWGLTFYLAYLYTGRSSLARPFAMLSGAHLLLGLAPLAIAPHLIALPAWSRPVVLVSGTLETLHFAYLVLLVAPLFTAALLFIHLRVKLSDPVQRLRLAAVAFSLLAWLVPGTFVAIWPGIAWLEITVRLAALVGILFVVLAYRLPTHQSYAREAEPQAKLRA